VRLKSLGDVKFLRYLDQALESQVQLISVTSFCVGWPRSERFLY
jgi:hypothetical protein